MIHTQNPENKREHRRVQKAKDRGGTDRSPRQPPAIRQAMAIVGVPPRSPSGSPPRTRAAPPHGHQPDLDLLLEESSTFSARGEASYRIPYADLSHLDEEVGAYRSAYASTT